MNQAQFLAVNYHYIQQTNLSVLFNSIFKVLNASGNPIFNRNLTLVLLAHSFYLVKDRNKADECELRNLKLISDDGSDPLPV
jgi:hypothetical protein